MIESIPEPYRRLPPGNGFTAILGPFYAALKDGRPWIGFRLESRHLNPFGAAHGAVIAGFADIQGLIVPQLAGCKNRLTPTIALTVDFIAMARLGCWVESSPTLLRRTSNLLFSEARVFADEVLIARSSAIFKLGPARAGMGADLGDFFFEQFGVRISDFGEPLRMSGSR